MDCYDHVHVCSVVPKILAYERHSMVISSSIYKRLLLLFCDIKDVTFLFRAFLLLGPTKIYRSSAAMRTALACGG